MSDSLAPRPPELIASMAAIPSAPPAPVVVHTRQALHAGRFHRWHVEEGTPQEEESWLITYLDVMTLLLVMMVVMLSFAEPRSTKLPKGEVAGAPGVGIKVAGQGEGVPSTVVPPIPLPHPVTASGGGTGQQPEPGKKPQNGGADGGVSLEGLGSDVQATVQEGVVSFRISSEVLFAPGDAALTEVGKKVMDTLLPVFNKAPDHTIVVEGHTDNQPINTTRFPSNWELAAGRAGSVVRHFQTRGINPTRLRATGYADTKPLASNNTAEGRSTNRRVELVMEAPRPPR